VKQRGFMSIANMYNSDKFTDTDVITDKYGENRTGFVTSLNRGYSPNNTGCRAIYCAAAGWKKWVRIMTWGRSRSYFMPDRLTLLMHNWQATHKQNKLYHLHNSEQTILYVVFHTNSLRKFFGFYGSMLSTLYFKRGEGGLKPSFPSCVPYITSLS
jgi:hypothetical protein